MKPCSKSFVTAALVVVLALLFTQAIPTYSQHPPLLGILLVNADTKTMVVPDSYPTIGAAVGNASQGDTILVKKGTYYENPVIDKSLTIVGEDSNGTMVIGSGGVDKGARAVFTLAADNVKLSGFTIKSLNYSSAPFYATGVTVAGDQCNVVGNNIVGTYYGVFCSIQSSMVISRNNITATLKDGIRICGGSSNTISDNNITRNAVSGVAIDGYSGKVLRNYICSNGRGVGIGASYSVVFGNNLTGNSESGVYFAASNSIISGNHIAGSKYGVYFTPYFANPNNDKFYNNNFVNNSQQVYISSPYVVESWDDGSKGNYWSDYNGIDANHDGTGDASYLVCANNTDRYPLAGPLSTLGVVSPPSALSPPPVGSNGTVALWHFDEVAPNGVTPDLMGNNPAVYGPAIWNVSSFRVLVEGESGKAFSFNGTDYAYAAASPSLDIQGEVTIDAWVNVREFKNVSYNNVAVECVRAFGYPTRVWGLAMNGDQSNSSVPVGVLRGFVVDSNGLLNEIVTTETLPLNQWVHVVFARNLTSGMHIYVNGAEQNVKVTSGVQNPTEPIQEGNELYIGHDSISSIDEVSISNVAITPLSQLKPLSQSNPLWLQWWFWTALISVSAMLTGAVYALKRSNSKRSPA
jgi:nitrous oxidase accessory protein NosD